MAKIKFICLIACFLILFNINSKSYASSFVEIKLNDGISFQLPRNWVILSDNNTITLNSFIESVLPVSSKVSFQANLKDDKGNPLTNIQIYRWKSKYFQENISLMSKAEIDDYDQVMQKNIQKELRQVGGDFTSWHGTKKLTINGLVVLASEYSRLTANEKLLGHYRVQVLRIYSGEQSFSFVISYHEETLLPLRILVDKIISTLRCDRCM